MRKGRGRGRGQRCPQCCRNGFTKCGGSPTHLGVGRGVRELFLLVGGRIIGRPRSLRRLPELQLHQVVQCLVLWAGRHGRARQGHAAWLYRYQVGAEAGQADGEILAALRIRELPPHALPGREVQHLPGRGHGDALRVVQLDRAPQHHHPPARTADEGAAQTRLGPDSTPHPFHLSTSSLLPTELNVSAALLLPASVSFSIASPKTVFFSLAGQQQADHKHIRKCELRN